MGMILKLRHILRFGRNQEGSVAVEFALCILPLLLIVGGIIDFGHAWYMEALLAQASREGARYATRYNDGKAPNTLVPSVQDFVLNSVDDNGGKGGFGLASLLPNDANPKVYPGEAGYTAYVAGAPVSVQVTALKEWFLISHLIPGMSDTKQLTATTVVSLE
jgi:Flp pilus assembly protein TadG